MYASKLKKSKTVGEDVWYAIHTTIIKTIQYPLLTMSLLERECNYIMAPILEKGLAASNICGKLDRRVVYGPRKFQGLAIPNLYTTQGITQLERLMLLGTDRSITSQLMMISLEQLKMELGIGGHIFHPENNIYFEYATECDSIGVFNPLWLHLYPLSWVDQY